MMKRFLFVAVMSTVLAAPGFAQTPLADKVRTLVDQARAASGFKEGELGLDVYRVMAAAQVPLSDHEAMSRLELAVSEEMNIEAEAAVAAATASGAYGGPSDRYARRNNDLINVAKMRAADDRKGGLAAAETEAIIKNTGLGYIAVGEANIGAGNYPTAIRLINRGLTRGGMTRSEIARATLVLGIACYRSGDVGAGQSAWKSVDADNGVRELAQAWLAISQAS